MHGQEWRRRLIDVVARHLPGASVVDHVARHPRALSYDLPQILETLEEGFREACTADLVVAWIPEASMGTAIEIHEAHRAGVPVVAITPLAVNWVVRACADIVVPDFQAFEAFAAQGGLDRLLAGRGR
ncbi:MAG: hypothetical protein JXB39_08355 [Deltaproteobacteria bacterium]|nr:hypothetical protein [Deltaproteobacteria bacterium]